MRKPDEIVFVLVFVLGFVLGINTDWLCDNIVDGLFASKADDTSDIVMIPTYDPNDEDPNDFDAQGNRIYRVYDEKEQKWIETIYPYERHQIFEKNERYKELADIYDPNDPIYKFIPEAPEDWRDRFGTNERTRLIHSLSELRVVVANISKRLIGDPNGVE